MITATNAAAGQVFLGSVIGCSATTAYSAPPGMRVRGALMGAAVGGGVAGGWPLMCFERALPTAMRLDLAFGDTMYATHSSVADAAHDVDVAVTGVEPPRSQS